MEKTEKKSLKGYYKTTFLIGLGFFTMGLMDPLYDTYVPVFLKNYIPSLGLVGTIMTFDNILAIFLIPIFAAISDRTRTSIGRRMPYIITLLPLTAIAFGLIPLTALNSLILLIVVIFLLNLFKQSVRGPVVALMPDMIPANLRSEANGVINTMGGIATIVGTIGLARLMNVYINIPGLGRVKDVLAFPVATVLVILAVILLFFFVKEKNGNYGKNIETEEKEKKVPIFKSLKKVFGEKDKSAFFILISLLCWFIAYQGVLPFVGLYSIDMLGTSSGSAGLAAGMVGIAYAIFAIPSGIYAHKHGRKKTIRRALICLVIVLLCIFAHGLFLVGHEKVTMSATVFNEKRNAEEQKIEDYRKAQFDQYFLEMTENNKMTEAQARAYSNEKASEDVKLFEESLDKQIVETEDTSKSMGTIRLISFWLLLFLFGIFWVTVITNSFPMLWQMADYKTMGIYTGLYYFFSQLASIIAPPLTGFCADLFGYGSLFVFASIFMLLAFLFMNKVKRGEPTDDNLEK